MLAEILASPLNYGYSAPIWRVLEALNGTRMRSLRQLLAAYDAFDGEFLEFDFSHGGHQIVLDAKRCRDSAAEILAMHAIPSSASKGLADPVAPCKNGTNGAVRASD